MAQLAKYSNSGKQGMATIPKKNDRLTLPRINFFSWFLIWSVPKIKILFNLAKCDENWELDKPLTELVFDNLFKSKRPEWIILFPEVNIWTEEASALQRRQSEKFYLPVLHNILYPRFSGFQNVISAINAKYNFKFTKLYDVTLNYYRAPKNSCTLDCLQPVNDRPRCPISLIEAFASNSDITITVNVKTRAVARIPNKRNKLEKWLENVWIDKDKLVTRMIQADREIDNCKQIKTKSIVSPSTEVLFHELTDDLVPGEKGIIISNSQGY
ncbi:uncharacterized protein PRCAT00002327001 [Priceomyces carsonii]|uniref:uncharacterized protein n=1 Tax=Priceomyces carsonii TaxID=28549 RepID=UPI002EDA367D|nr:unnamed protein product [Priceomyces carsonii]